eukprot:TRINITY_DN42111_c0_g1_i2.p1 TRINITY_DN42111_c0_g1~~TRINITY_DN42111_c0_g1_i2.p1  ORF type:complete len:263 (+),score=14.28 TRINITY_DN42111_c0_g1_i2:674-1462(+)
MNQIEKVHTYAIKRFLNLPLHSSNTFTYGETGRYPIYIKTFVKCISYWLKLIRLPTTRLSRQTYEMLLHQDEVVKFNWVSQVKKALIENGFGIVWLCQGVGFENYFIEELKDRLIANFKQNWHLDIESNPKYTWFFSFKDIFQPEKYLSNVANRWNRDALLKFRARVCGFKSNSQWFTSTENNDSASCPLCQQDAEDEVHFLFNCIAYSNIRAKYNLFTQFSTQTDMKDVVSLLKSNDETIILSLSGFIAEALKQRKMKLEK